MNVGSAWGNNVFNVFGYDETNEEWKHLGNVDTKKQFNFNPSAGPEYMASITLKFSIADYFKKYKITLDKYNQDQTLYYKDSGLEVPKEYCISSCICKIQIDGLYIPILT